MIVLPLRAVLFQLLFVMVAIAVETPVLQRLLLLPRPLSVRYATVLNVMSTAIGWGIFFIIYSSLSEVLKTQLISYVFFGKFYQQVNLYRIQSLLQIIGVLTFFGTVFVEWLGLKLLLAIQRQLNAESLPKILRLMDEEDETERRPVFDRFIPQISKPPSEANALLAANALSYALIALLLVFRYFERGGMAS